MKTNIKIQQSTGIALTPQLLQSIRLLQLSAQELEQEVEQALEDNVLLERDEEAVSAVESIDSVAEVADDSIEVPVSGCDAAATERVEADYDWSSSESWSGGEPSADGESFEARQPNEPVQDARVAALAQLELMLNDPIEQQLAVLLVAHVDDNGYLECALPDILAQQPAGLNASLSQLEQVLGKVQSVEPTGFAARDLRECLLLQLEALPGGISGRNLAEQLVDGYLERVAARDFLALRRELGASEQKFIDAMELIRTLDPKPGASRVEPAQAVVPDLVVSGHQGHWKVELNPVNLPRLRVNSAYSQQLAGAGHRRMAEQLQQARWLVRGLQMRHETLLKTAQFIFERQSGFLHSGELGMLPLTLREVAEAIEMHESTVCRVTSNKYVQTPWGVYALKDFFPSSIARGDADAPDTSGVAVRAMIRNIVDNERPDAPLCDGEITAILRRSGVVLVRRTVAKYREAMKIAPAKERRQPMRPADRYTFAAATAPA